MFTVLSIDYFIFSRKIKLQRDSETTDKTYLVLHFTLSAKI